MASACHDEPGLINTDPDISVLPFISHTAGVPSLFCHRMSALPAPSKSPVPMMWAQTIRVRHLFH
jgi:hypothetical protein